jgi:phosphomannomutase
MAGLAQEGKEIVEIGLSTTPMFYFAVNRLKADGGIMVTGSHIEGEYNGFKMVREKAIPVSYDTGICKIEEMVKTEEYSPSDYSTTKENVREDYLNFIAKGEVNLKGKLVVDTGNGMMGLVIKEFLERLSIDYVPLYFEIDCTFPNHVANPLKVETLEDLRKELEKEDAILGVAFDGDGDRLGILDEKGEVVPGDIITAMVAQNILKSGPKKILYDLRSSKVVPEVIESSGGTPVKSRIGHSLIKERMRKEDIFFAGEVSGHFYFKEIFNVESSLTALIKILETMSETGKTMSELVKPLKKYWKTEEINFKVEDKKGKLAEIEEVYSCQGAKIEKIDGVTVIFPGWWFNLRPSNTENLLRLNLEADIEELMEEKTRELEEIIGGRVE